MSGALSACFWYLGQISLIFFTVINILLHEALSDWNCLFGAKVKFSPLEIKNLTPFTISDHTICDCNWVKLYCQITSQQEVASCLFQKTQNHDQRRLWREKCYEEKNDPVCFSGKFNAATIQLPLGKKYFLCHHSPISRFTKMSILAVSELYKDTSRTHCSIPWEKMSLESVLWVFTTRKDVTIIRWNCTVRLYPRKKWQAAYCIEKTHKCVQICCCNEEQNEPVCFPGRVEAATIQVSQREISFAIRPQFPGSKNMFPFTFRAV